MAFSTGNEAGGLTNEINVTPMIDVLLVLLIIFMMLVPMLRKAIDLQLPDPTPAPANSTPNPDQIVLQIGKSDAFKINSEVVPKDKLLARLKEIYDPRPEKIIFIKGEPGVKFQDVITGMDIARGAGVKVLGVAPKDPNAK
ncbi:MAG: biopolymer transporter ExbD [Gemmatimonadota bacterium]|nr:biopolymer transporter ExbD [Gemmatimonadota bacterium]